MQQEEIESKLKNMKEIEDIIAKALKKVGATKEVQICRYLPMNAGGYMHHFTLKKMKKRQPEELASIIKKHIMNVEKPGAVAPKHRAARGSRKRKDQINFTHAQLEKMLKLARQMNDKEMIDMLSPKRSLVFCKKALLSSIRQGKVEEDLWHAYVEAVNAQAAILSFNESLAQG